MFQQFNPNPKGRSVGDCTVRALSMALSAPWDETYLALCAEGFDKKDMPSSNAVWGSYLKSKGFQKKLVPDTCPDCYTVTEFAQEHPKGTFVLLLSGHVVTIIDGVLYDSWDSSNETVLAYFERSDEG